MIELVIVIIIIAWVIKKKQKSISEGPMGNGQIPNTTVTTAKTKGNVYSNGSGSYTGAHTANSTVTQHKAARQRAKEEAIREAKEDGNSTTAYLMEKAEADAREHAREKYEEQKRLHEASGGLVVAERLFDGDPVPQGKRCAACGYCGAENLVPMVPRMRYSCYFCREPLN